MCHWSSRLLFAAMLFWPACATAADAQPANKYFAHAAVEDGDGVIAPWYRGQNGQCDFRVRIAAETLKRYPWTDKSMAVMAAPYFVFSGSWGIKPDGTIIVSPKLDDWMNADVGQRSVSTLFSEVAYYRYTGDPAAIGLIVLTADYLLGLLPDPGRSRLAQLHHQRPGERKSLRPGQPARLHPTGPQRAARLGRARGLQADGQSALPGGRQALGRSAGRALRPAARRGAVEPLRQPEGLSLERARDGWHVAHLAIPQ